MFTNKNKKKITVPTIETTQVTVPTLQGLATAGASAVEAARHWGEEQAENAGDWAAPRLEKGQKAAAAAAAIAAARAEKGNERLSELVAQAKDRGEEARAEAADRRQQLAEQVRGEVKKNKKQAAKTKKDLRKQVAKKQDKKSGGFLSGLFSVLGILAIAGAAAAYYAKKQAQPKEDPWARPLTDPYVAPAGTRTSTTAPADAAGAGTNPTSTTGTASTAGTSYTGTHQSGTTDTTRLGTTAPVSDPSDTPPAKLGDEEVVDLTAGGLPPESDVEARDASGTTLGDAVRDDRHHG